MNIISNHLKPICLYQISLKKRDCVEGRKFLDGIMVSHEIVHSFKNSKKTSVLIDLDVFKSFEKFPYSPPPFLPSSSMDLHIGPFPPLGESSKDISYPISYSFSHLMDYQVPSMMWFCMDFLRD